jgi:flagellar basal body P-ring formation protein FlgA
MRIRLAALFCALAPLAAFGESVVALRTLPARTVIASSDITVVAAEIEGAVASADLAIGQELKTTIYAGRPVRAQDLGPQAIVERNQIVVLIYRSGPLTIAAEGRALDKGAEGDIIRAMNLATKSTVSGRITADGTLQVGDRN